MKKINMEKIDKLNNNKKNELNLSKTIFSLYKEFYNFSDETKNKYLNWENDINSFETFWNFVKSKWPELLLTQIDKKKSKIYFDQIKNQEYKIKNVDKLKIKSNTTEKDAIQDSINIFLDYCKKNSLPENICKNFTDAIWIEKTTKWTINIKSNSKIKNLSDLLILFKKYTKDNNIKLDENHLKNIKKILSPDFDYTEKMMISAYIEKLKSKLWRIIQIVWKNKEKEIYEKFNDLFKLPIDINSDISTLIETEKEFEDFKNFIYKTIDDKKIEDKTKKDNKIKIDKIFNWFVISNQDIAKELKKYKLWWVEYNFSKRSKHAKIVFSQLTLLSKIDKFEELKKNLIIEDKINYKLVKPMLNNIFLYPFAKLTKISKEESKQTKLEKNILKLQKSIKTETDEKKIFNLEKKLYDLNIKLYIRNIAKFDKTYSEIINNLFENKRNFWKLNYENKKTLILKIIEQKKLKITEIKNQLWIDMAEVFWTKQAELYKQLEQLYDIENKKFEIDTINWKININFLKKEFSDKNISIFDILQWDLDFPLDFIIDVNEEWNNDFKTLIEHPENDLWSDLFFDIDWKRICSSYKIKTIIKWKEYEWYLSKKWPSWEDWYFLYSSPNEQNFNTLIKYNNFLKRWKHIIVKPDSKIEILEQNFHLDSKLILRLLITSMLSNHYMQKKISKKNEQKLENIFNNITKTENNNDNPNQNNENNDNQNENNNNQNENDDNQNENNDNQNENNDNNQNENNNNQNENDDNQNENDDNQNENDDNQNENNDNQNENNDNQNENNDNQNENNDNQNENDDNQNLNQRNTIDKYQAFLNKWKTLNWFQFEWENDLWFKEWTSLYINNWPSELPPKSWDQRVKISIIWKNKNSWKFRIKINWWELEMWKEFENKTFYQDIDEKTLTRREKNFWKWNIFKLPKLENWNDKFQKAVNNIKKTWISVWWIDVFSDDLEFNWKTFKNKNWQKVQYFWNIDVDYDYTQDWDILEQNIMYEISHNSNWTFNVKTSFLEKEWNKKNKYIKYKYDRDLSYYDFILLVWQKNLKPLTEKQKLEKEKKLKEREKEVLKQEDWGKRQLFTIWNIISFIKDWKNKVKWMLDKINENKLQDLNEALVWWWKLYEKISNFMWWIWLSNLSEAFLRSQIDRDKWHDERMRWNIQFWMDIFSAEADFAIVYTKYIEPFLVWWKKPQDEYMIPAAMLMLMKKWWIYQRSALKLMWKWKRIELVLWKQHKDRFLILQDQLKQKMEKLYWENLWTVRSEKINEELIKFETTYIIEIMDWRQVWFKWDKRAEQRKWLDKRSKKFMDELEWAQKKLYSKSYIEDIYNWISWNVTFNFASANFKWNLWKWTIHKALAFYKKMAMTITTEEERKEFLKHTLALVLSWVWNNMLWTEEKKFIQNICRSTWILPWIEIRDMKTQKNIANLINYYTWWDLNKFYDIEKLEPENFKTFWDFINNFYWDFRSKNANKIYWLFEMKSWELLNLINDKNTPDNIVNIANKLKSDSMEWSENPVDNDVSLNFLSNMGSPLNLSQWLIKKYMNNVWKWVYSWTEDEVEASKYIRDWINSSINTWNLSWNKEQLIFQIQKLFNWFEHVFNSSFKDRLARSITTAKNLKNQWNEHDAKEIIENLIYWTLYLDFRWTPKEVDDAIKSFSDMFRNNLDVFDEWIISNSFWFNDWRWVRYVESFNNPLQFLDRETYYRATWRSSSWAQAEDIALRKKEITNKNIYINPIIDEIKKKLD